MNSKKSSSDICSEIKRIKAQKNVHINDAEIKNALDIAEKLDKYSRLLQKKKKLLKDNKKGIDESLRQTLKDMSQLDMIKLQNSMNNQSQLMQMMSNIQKIMNDISMGIIRNIK